MHRRGLSGTTGRQAQSEQARGGVGRFGHPDQQLLVELALLVLALDHLPGRGRGVNGGGGSGGGGGRSGASGPA